MDTGGSREPTRTLGVGSWAADAGILALAAALPRLLELLSGGVPGASDLGTLFLPNWGWWWEESRWWGGWNPWIFSGYPADGDPLTSRFHPLALLYGALEVERAAALEAFLLQFFAALGMLAYLRQMGIGRVGSLLGALAFGMGGYIAANGVHPAHLRSAVAIPWALLVLERSSGAGLVAGIAAVVGWVLLGGHPQTIVYSLLFVGIYAVWFGRPLVSGRLPAMLMGAAVGLLVGAALWVPALRWIADTTRILGTPPFPDPRLVPDQWYWLWTPFQSLFAGGVGSALGRDAICGVVECGGYPGLVVWFLLVAALPFLVRTARGRFWLFIAALSLVVASGWVPLPFMRGPSRILLWWSLASAALVGLCFSYLQREVGRGRYGLVGAAVLLVDVLLILASVQQGWSWPSFLLAQGVLGVSSLILVAGPRWSGCLVVLLVLELSAFQWLVVPFAIPRSEFEALQAPVAVAEGVLDEAGPSAAENPRVLFLPAPLETNWASSRRVPVLHGYNLLVSQWYALALGQNTDLALESVGHIDDPQLASPSSHVLDLLRTGLVLRDPELPSALGDAIAEQVGVGGRWQRGVDTPEGFEVYWNRRARPVAWLVGGMREVDARREMELLRGRDDLGGFDPQRQALLRERLALPGEEVSGSVRVEPSGEDVLRLLVQASRPALLVTSELAAPGWQVEVDGEPRPMVVANAGFRAVEVGAGASEVVFRYAPRLAWLGAALSLLGLVLLAAFTVRAVSSDRAVS